MKRKINWCIVPKKIFDIVLQQKGGKRILKDIIVEKET